MATLAPGVTKNKNGTVTYSGSGGTYSVQGGKVVQVAPAPTTSPSSSNIVNFNTATGQRLKQGETFRDPNTGLTFTQGQEFNPTSYIGAVQQKEGKKEILPTFQNNLGGMYDTGLLQAKSTYQSLFDAEGKPITNAFDVSQQNQDKSMQDFLSNLLEVQENRPSEAELYRKAQKETGILERQKEVAQLSGQLGAITAQGQANQLSVVGQGRGIPEAIIGGQQAQIARETAIQALPVAAQLAAAQGNLEMAEKNLNTLFSIKSAEAKQDYDFKVNVLNTLYQYGTVKENKALAQVEKIQERQYQEQQADIQKATQYANTALQNNQGVLAGKLMNLDPKSPTFKTDLAKYASQIYDPSKELDIKIKKAQLNKLNQDIEISKATTGTTTGVETSQASRDIADVASSLFNNKGLKNITGTLDQFLGGFTNKEAKLAKNQWEQLRGMLSLENRQKLKGSGAISDYESKVLAQASTVLGRNLDTQTFKTELLNLMTKLSPEYQYINNIDGLLTEETLQTNVNNYVNSLGL